MKHLVFPALLLPALFSGPALSAPETYVVDPTHTLPRFAYTHMGYSSQQSRFDKTSGVIVLDRAAKVGSVNIDIDASSVDTGVAMLNDNLKGADFFDADNYPVITFIAPHFAFDETAFKVIEGELTIKGITRPVTLTVQSFLCSPHPRLKKDACGATATAVIKRSDFNLNKFVPLVGDEVVLTIPVEAISQ